MHRAVALGMLCACGRFNFNDRAMPDPDAPGSSDGSSVDAPLDSPPPDAITHRQEAIVDGYVEDGLTAVKDGAPDTTQDNSIVQILDTPDFEDRGILEFALPPGIPSVSFAKLLLPVFNSMGPFPFPIEVFAYSIGADGALALTDWTTSGVSLGTFMYSGEPAVAFEVTQAVQNAVSSTSSFIGFRFEFQIPSTIMLDGPYVAFNTNELPPVTELLITE